MKRLMNEGDKKGKEINNGERKEKTKGGKK